MPITLEFAHRVGGILGKVPKGAKITDTICEPNPTRGISPCRVHCASAGISSARWVIGSGRAEHLAEAWCVHPRPFNAIFFRDPPPPPSPPRRGFKVDSR